jgi:hypothetical protein
MARKLHTTNYHDWTALVDAAVSSKAPILEAHGGSKSWTQTKSFDHAVKLAREGWPEGRDMVAALSHAYFEKLAAHVERSEYYRAETGEDFDVALVLQGEPEAYIVEQRETVEGPGRRIVRIVFNAGGSSGISTEVLTARGAAVVALVMLLEYAGHGVEVVTVYTAGGMKYTVQTVVNVKRADQPPDLPLLAFALAHPSTFRRIIFRVWESLPQYLVDDCGFVSGGGYGSPMETPERGDINLIGETMYPDVQWTSPESARAWIVANLTAQGVKVTA